MFKRFFLFTIVFALAGCNDPEPQVIDMDEVAAEAGLKDGAYKVHENGAIEIKSLESIVSNDEQPAAVQGESWHYIVNNGIREADKYAADNNPAATFVGNNVDADLDKQYGGKYEGEYLLTILNDNPNSVSYAQLRPLFDMNESSDSLDDESKLWEVTIAKYNGREF